MEQYSIDGEGRAGVYTTLALISVGLAYLVHHEVGLLPFHAPWWVDVPSLAVIFGVFNVLFDRWLWRLNIFGFRVSKIPDFSGKWTGIIRARDSAGSHLEIPVTVRIAQTWSSIGVKGVTANGVTRSKIAGIRMDEDELRYEYETQTHMMETEGRHHVGFAVLQKLDPSHIEGYYYTLEGSTTKGAMVLERV